MPELNKDLLGKIVALAKGGVGGEKQNAIRLVKKLCVKHNLKYEDVMNDSGVAEFHLDFKRGEKQLAIQVICRYARMKLDEDLWSSRDGLRMYFKTTTEKYVETVNAYEILSRKYKEEKQIVIDSLEDAFFSKHNLFYQPTEAERKKMERRERDKEKKKTEKEKAEEEKKIKVARALMGGLDDVHLLRQLTGK